MMDELTIWKKPLLCKHIVVQVFDPGIMEIKDMI